MELTVEDLRKLIREEIAPLKEVADRKVVAATPSDIPVKVRAEMWLRGAFFPPLLPTLPDCVKKDLSLTDAAGGYLVPDEYRAELIRRLPELSEVYPYVRRIPVSKDTGYMPRQAADVTVAWDANENDTASEWAGTSAFEQLAWNIHKLRVMTDVSLDLIEDSDPEVTTVLTDMMLKAIAAELDRAIVIGNDAANEPYGIYYRVKDDTNQIYNVNGALNYDKLVAIEHKVAAKYRKRGSFRWIMPDAVHAIVMRLKDSNGQPLVRRDVGSIAGPGAETLLGYLISLQEMNGRSTEIILGNVGYYYLFDRKQVSIESTYSGSKWEKDITTIKARLRCDGDVALTQAFAMGYGITG